MGEGIMHDLIARLEAAEVGSIPLDKAIAEAIGKPGYHDETMAPNAGRRIPRYTESLDASLTLVPDHALSRWERLRFERHSGGFDCFLDGDDSFAATPALALCIAALKAREAG